MDTPILERLIFDREERVFTPSAELESYYFEWLSRVSQAANEFGTIPQEIIYENLEGLSARQAGRLLDWLAKKGYIGIAYGGYSLCPAKK